MTHDVALIGAGAMGGAIDARLLQTGSRLAVFDLDPVKVAALVAGGAAPSTLIIDKSSIDPESTRAPAAEAATNGLHRVDSPLSGESPRLRRGN
jgi:2-hydroxy-3-oxopropionate reductase